MPQAIRQSDTTSGWQRLLTGDLRVQAEQTVAEIAACLTARQSVLSAHELSDAALFFGYLAQAQPHREYGEQALRWLNEAISRAEEELPGPWFYQGFTSVAWVIAHLGTRPGVALFGAEELESCAEVDQYLSTWLTARSPWRGHFELIQGLTGYGVYALERLPEAVALKCLQLVLKHLVETAEPQDAGLTWFTRPELLPQHQRQVYPQGYYNLGLAHGVPGVIALLARASRVPEVRTEASRLLNGAVSWLLTQRCQSAGGDFYPYWNAPGSDATPARLGWCYGDLSVGLALLTASRYADQPEWRAAALPLLRRAASLELAASGVEDAGLCHGAAGNAHLFNRVYQITGEDIFRRAALYWYEQVFVLRQPEQGLAGFLDGTSGIGLALLAGLDDHAPDWDRRLLQ